MEDVVTKRSDHVNEHDRREQVGQDHVRPLDQQAHRAIHCCDDRGHVDPNRSLVMGTRNVVATIQPVSATTNMST